MNASHEYAASGLEPDGLQPEAAAHLHPDMIDAMARFAPSARRASEVLEVTGGEDKTLSFVNATETPLTDEQVRGLHFAVSSLASITGNRIFDRAVGIVLQPHEEFIGDTRELARFDTMLGENDDGLVRVSDKVFEWVEREGSFPKYKDVLSAEAYEQGNAWEQLLIHELGHSVDISFKEEFYAVDGRPVPAGVNPDDWIDSDLYENVKMGVMPHDPSVSPQPQPLTELFDDETIANAQPVTTYGHKAGEATAEFLVPYVYHPNGAEPVQKMVLEGYLKHAMRGQPQMGPVDVRVRQVYAEPHDARDDGYDAAA